MAGFVEFDETGLLGGVGSGVTIFKVVDVAVKERIFGKEFDDAEGFAANSDDVHAAVFVSLDEFQDFGGAADVDDTFRNGEEQAEGRIVVETLADHAPVPRFKNVQGELFAGEKNDVEREERNAIGGHGFRRNDSKSAVRRGYFTPLAGGKVATKSP